MREERLENLHSVDSNEGDCECVCGFEAVKRKYFGSEVITGRVKKLKNRKAVGIDRITGQMTQNEGKMYWI